MKSKVIVVGSGISGLVSSLKLLEDGFQVEIYEKNNTIGGSSREIRKGRYFFDLVYPNLYYGKGDKNYQLNNFLKAMNIKEVEMVNLTDSIKITLPEKEYILPRGVDNFIAKMEEYVPNSKNSLKLLFDLAKEVDEAMEYMALKGDNGDYNYVLENYENFAKVAPYSVSKVMDILNVPLMVQDILNAFFIFFGSTETAVSFGQYITFLYNYLEYGFSLPVYGSLDVANCLGNAFLERGGKIYLNSRVKELVVEEGEVRGVLLDDGTVEKADIVLVNSSLHNVYGNLVKPALVPRGALQTMNQREFAPSRLTVYLGLSRSAQELEINESVHFIYQSLDTDMLAREMQSLEPIDMVAICPSLTNDKVCDKDCTVLSLTTLYFDNGFDKILDEGDVNENIEEIARSLIKSYEKATGVDLESCIEEVEIISPIDDKYVCNTYNFGNMGYAFTLNDNLLSRVMSVKNEHYLKNLYLCEGISGDAFGYASAIYNGSVEAVNINSEGGEKDDQN